MIGVRAIRRAILSWYDSHRRDLPWRRRQGDPYAQWVAEIMLQQTRVDTVIPYYERFLSRFPTVRHLAKARHEVVLKHWEGLGYYRRAMHLHEAAKVVAAGGGEFPGTSEGLRELPGVGDYTAAAIASIAYREPIAAVDGNVARVVARLFAIGGNEPVGSAAGRSPSAMNGRAGARDGREWNRRVKDAANRLIAPDRPGDLNQALMDLGSAICRPRNPACGQCPVRRHCRAFRTGRCDEIPPTKEKSRPDRCRILAVAFVHDGRLLMRRRPRGGLWSGLWELPCREWARGESLGQAMAALSCAVGETASRARDQGRERAKGRELEADGRAQHIGRAVRVRHQLTHRDLAFTACVCRLSDQATEPRSQEATKRREIRWVDSRQLEGLAVSTAHRKILAALGADLGEALRQSLLKLSTLVAESS